jgi:amino acid transporter
MKKKGAIGLWSAVSIGVGGMIGAGIFSITGVATQISGNLVYLSFLIAGIVALMSTYSYAKLGVRFPSAGGPVEFLIRGLGDGVMSGGLNILLWISYVFALALYARAFGSYAATFLPEGSHWIWVNILATMIVLVFVAVNFIGARAVGRSELFIVAIKVVILVAFSVLGFFSMKPNLLAVSGLSRSADVLFGAGIVFIGYEGFGLITNAAEDMENPGKILPRALYLSVAMVMVIYVSVSIAVLGNLPVPEIVRAKEYALAAAARPFLGMIGFRVMAIAALFSTASAINATLYGGANVSYVIARRGELPRIFERKIWGNNHEGLFITAGMVLLFANLFDLTGIATIGSAFFLVIYAAVNLAHLRLWRQTGARPWIVWSSVAGCLVSLVIMLYYAMRHSPMTLVVFLVVPAACFFLEWLYRKITGRCMLGKCQGP